MKTLHIAPTLSLPADAITQTFGILAVRGAGKSNLGAVMAEGMFEAGLPFVVVDPVGSWFGLRSSGDGKKPGLAVPIFGGRHGDVPLERTAGNLIADMVVEERLSCVLDVSEFSEGDKVRFLTDFAERLYHKNQDPLHLFLEEADDYAPQKPFREQARLLRAWENIVRRGRARGLGITMITQRSAALNKNVLTQIETLFVLRTTSPQDRKAISAWVEYHGQAGELLESLPGLESGEAWVWSPSWLNVLKRVKVRRRWTYDSGATPKDIQGRRPITTLADVDLGALQKRMAATVERAKAEDPRELRRRIAELERAVKAPAQAVPQPKIERVEVQVLKDSQIKRLEAAIGKLHVVAGSIGEKTQEVVLALRQVRAAPAGLPRRLTAAPTTPPRRLIPALPPHQSRQIRPASPVPAAEGSEALGNGGLRRILTALAQRPAGLTNRQVGVRAGLSSKSGSFANYLSKGRKNGWLDGSGTLHITEAGLQALGGFEPLPEGRELLNHWLGELGGSGSARMLRALAEVYPESMPKENLGEAAGLSHASGSFANYLSRLRSLELIEGRGDVKISEELV